MNRLRVAVGLIWLLWCGAANATAHDFGAMLVELTLTESGAYRGTIRIDPQHLPAAQGTALWSPDLVVRTSARTDLQGRLVQGAALRFGSTSGPERLRLCLGDRVQGSEDGTIRWVFEGRVPAGATALTWRSDAEVGRYLLRVAVGEGGDSSNQWLDPGQTSRPIDWRARSAGESWAAVLASYVGLGFTHIIPHGLDHILFVLALFLLSARLKPVLMQATAFTVAHSVTLALAACGVLSPSPAIVEPMIAASIAFIGLENILVRRYTSRRIAVAFGFGLLHGLGFAGVLSEVGLPRAQLVPALLGFNIGVELGQAAVILAAFLLLGAWCDGRGWYRARVVIPASAAIVLVAVVWTIERLPV